jgi:hypothetical protein
MKYFSYEECKEYLKDFDILSSHQFYILAKKGSFDEKVNKRPYEFYKRKHEWVSWTDFLSSDGKSKYLEFREARDYVRTLKLKNQKDWCKWCVNKGSIKIPSNPSSVYKEWVSLADWLGLNSFKNLTNINYLSYDDCKLFIKQNFNIKNRKQWLLLDRNILPINIPKRPDHVYKKDGKWINWETFLDSQMSPLTKSKQFLDYKSAVKLLKELNLIDRFEYLNYIKKNNITFLPKRPEYVYRSNWSGYLNYLTSDGNKKSIGEKLIKRFLEEKNIEFETEKKFIDCKNINKLPFDFYIQKLNLCIEFDGELHFKPCVLFGGENTLERIKRNDEIKNNYCINNNIHLLRISYKNKDKISEILSNFFQKNSLYL